MGRKRKMRGSGGAVGTAPRRDTASAPISRSSSITTERIEAAGAIAYQNTGIESAIRNGPPYRTTLIALSRVGRLPPCRQGSTLPPDAPGKPGPVDAGQ